jgi:DNA repair protein RadC
MDQGIMADLLPLLGIPSHLVGRFPNVRSLFGCRDSVLADLGVPASALERIGLLRQVVSDYFAGEYQSQSRNFSSVEDVVDYVGSRIAHLPHEHVMILALDAHCRLIGERCSTEHRAAQVTCDVEKVAEWASEIGAAQVVVVHNHPSETADDLRPSGNDIAHSESLRKLLSGKGIELIDTIVVGRGNLSYSKTHGPVRYGQDDDIAADCNLGGIAP